MYKNIKVWSQNSDLKVLHCGRMLSSFSVCVCVGISAHCIQDVGLACLRQRGNLAEHRLLYEPQDVQGGEHFSNNTQEVEC